MMKRKWPTLQMGKKAGLDLSNSKSSSCIYTLVLLLVQHSSILRICVWRLTLVYLEDKREAAKVWGYLDAYN
jgi:hypothetical protein